MSYRSPEMVDLYSGKTISTKADIWVIIKRMLAIIHISLKHCTMQHRMIFDCVLVYQKQDQIDVSSAFYSQMESVLAIQLNS